jgi:hypothetical protein
VLILFSCSEKDEKKIVSLKGVVQKGPFQTGTNITIYELDKSLNQTGKSFNTTVYDDFGNFDIQNIEIGSDFIEVVADGFYFNEKQGEASDNKLVLKTIADVSNSEKVNINILTYLETERIKFLVQNQKLDFADAKQQAEEEILGIFKFETNSDSNFESLDISTKGELNNKLAAISLILLQNNTASELSNNLTEICFDLKDDGVLNSEGMKNRLATSARLLDLGQMIRQLIKFYNDTSFYGIPSWIDYFLEHTDFNSSIKVDFPVETATGKNILRYPFNAKLNPGESYGVGVNVDRNQTKFDLGIAVQCEANTGSISVTSHNLDGWQLDLDYRGYNPEFQKSFRGFLIKSLDPAKTSGNPISFTMSGTGDVLVTLFYQGNNIPNGGACLVRSFYKL